MRSVLIILFISFMPYQLVTSFVNNAGLVTNLMEVGKESSVYTAVIELIVSVFGFLFVFATSHDLINKEVELKTVRLLVTKVSRVEIILGKLLGTMLFWIVTVSISFAVLTVIAGSWFPKDYLQSLIFLFYIINFVVLISIVIIKTELTMFLGGYLFMRKLEKTAILGQHEKGIDRS